jgi:hypothetical protein
MNTRIFLVDVESTGPSPARSVMTEFGVVDFETRAWFHGHLWDFKPTPGIPALPIATERNPGFTAYTEHLDDENYDGTTRHSPPKSQGTYEKFVFLGLTYWMAAVGGLTRPVFVSDNPGWDFMWMAYGFDSVELENPFGHSSRRIGDFAAGLAGKWNQQTKWKSLRETRHTHNPVDDAMGNAEALAKLLAGAS